MVVHWGMEQSKRNAGLEMRKGEGEEDGRRGWSDVRLAMEELSLFKTEEKKVSTLALLGASNLLLHVLGLLPSPPLPPRLSCSFFEFTRLEVLISSSPAIWIPRR